jgi:glycosyltransferase involved in cell wall biosynthesis
MFIVPCKYIEGKSLIRECIQSIKQHHPKELIVVVDSNSDDKSYFAYIEDIPNVVICDKKNVHYIIGALWQAYEMFPDEHHYVLIHDTIIIKKPLTKFLHDEETYSFLYFDDHVIPPHHQAVMDRFILPNYSSNVSTPIIGVFGTAAIFKNAILKKFVSKNLHNTYLPINKEECQMSERVLGVLLAAEGIDIIANCIEQKNCLSHWSKMFTDGFEYIRKTITIRE